MDERIIIAGATGFVGNALLSALGRRSLIGLSRTAKQSRADHPNVEWRACNLLELPDTQRALAGATTAVYLVHSMIPQATLIRGSFEDMDLICADNFARAAKSCGVRHIIYLSGLVPDEPKLSRHLTSRLEVEQTFKASGIRLTTLRAGMIVGPGSSSFELMSRLVARLPFIIAPRWTKSKSQAIALSDVINVLLYVLDHPKQCAGTWDIGCPEVLTYREMMAQTAQALGKKARIFDIPFNVPALSLLGVSLLTGTPRQLVVPLVQSLQHTMVAKHGLRLQANAGIRPTPFKKAIRDAIKHDSTPPAQGSPAEQSKKRAQTIFFVQRLAIPPGATALWVARECARWLPKILSPLIKVVVQDCLIYRFCVPGTDICLLELTFSAEQSSASRQLFYISGGLWTQPHQTELGYVEFRAVFADRYVLVIVHDVVARRLWLSYKVSQAALYASVMYYFGRHLDHLTRADVQRRVDAE